jgi:isopentenyl-diphosphate Delta-isomerase
LVLFQEQYKPASMSINAMIAKVILVNEHDEPIGIEEKLAAHQEGLLHRAFSILVFDSEGRLLLQQRALDKYHCGGLWTNTCCSHPCPNEPIEEGIHTRLQYEMGFDTHLDYLFKFQYKAPFSNGLIEHEIDYVFVGESDQTPQPNPNEVMAYRWISMSDLKNEIQTHPEWFTPWFPMILERYEQQNIEV